MSTLRTLRNPGIPKRPDTSNGIATFDVADLSPFTLELRTRKS
ncbi:MULTISPECIES: hypothetical protein [Microvirga]|nr:MULTISPECIES: hypothetical protein [unclassified Microvirga]